MNNTHLPTPSNSVGSLKVLHFVTGGFTGSTAVAIELVRATTGRDDIDSLLVLRKKKSTDKARVTALQKDIAVAMVPGWSHLATIIALVKLCKMYKPDILVAHGFSEHLWGRYAGLIAKVPHLIHVEHNSRERYTKWRLLQARWLAQFTARIIGCSEGVRQVLLGLKFTPEKTMTICNGIHLAAYEQAHNVIFNERAAAIIMPSRFARQKDHCTLIKAIALLAERGITPEVTFAGAGSQRHINQAKRLAEELNLTHQIHFLGFCNNIPERLLNHQICVLSSHYEGMPLALVEGMAAGCAVVGTAVVGIKEMLRHEQDGLLVAEHSATELADALEKLLTNTEYAAKLGARARARAHENFSVATMTNHYETVFRELVK
jgi:glycosyltransferase involved in cell wall biosynthesis